MIMGLLQNSTNGLGLERVKGLNRVPYPPTRIRAFMFQSCSMLDTDQELCQGADDRDVCFAEKEDVAFNHRNEEEASVSPPVSKAQIESAFNHMININALNLVLSFQAFLS